jgi:hypothetical protein
MNKDVEDLLTTAIRKSLGDKGSKHYSIMECADNKFLKEDYDPFEQFSMQLLADKVRKQLAERDTK